MSGYVLLPGWLLALKPSANAVLVYATLATYGTFNTAAGAYEECRPTIATMAADSGTSDSTVKRALGELLGLKAVERTERWAEDGKTRLPSVYRVIFGALVGPSEPSGSTGEPTPQATGEPRVGSPVTHNQEPSTKNPKTKKKHAAEPAAEDPNAGLIVKGLIDWLAAEEQGAIVLTRRVIVLFGVRIKALLDQGVPAARIKVALGAMHEAGRIGSPALLDNFVVQVQNAPRPKAPPQSFADQERERKAAGDRRALAIDALMEAQPGLSVGEAVKVVDAEIQKRLASRTGDAYIEGVSVSADDAREVTG